MVNLSGASPMNICLGASAGVAHPFLQLRLHNGLISIGLSIEGTVISNLKAPIWSHTIFELEKLSEGLRYVVNDLLPDYLNLPSREGWIGPEVGLTPALWFQLGHPGIGNKGRGLMMYVSRIHNEVQGTSAIEIEATCNEASAVATFGDGQILSFADEVYAAAKSLVLLQEKSAG